MKYFILYIGTIFFTVGVFAQQDSLKIRYDTGEIQQRKFDTDNLEKYKSDTDFNYEVKKRKISLLERIWDWFKRIFLKVLS